MSITISVVSKQPPGGRCSLYRRFAEAVADAVGGRSEVLYPQPESPFPEQPVPPAPALLIDGQCIAPADGVILSPAEICDALAASGFNGDLTGLLQTLEAIEEAMMEGWEAG